MPKPKAKRAKKQKKEEPETSPAQTVIQPWMIEPYFRERVYVYLPAIFEGMKTLHEDLEEIKTLLKE